MKSSITPRERFLAVASGDTSDYVPIFGFPGAPGMAGGCMRNTHARLVATGMPAHVGGPKGRWPNRDVESWQRYWGTTGPDVARVPVACGAEGFRQTRRVEGEYEVITSENGSVTRQLLDNDFVYTMPEFVRYPVRDRDSWTFYKDRTEPVEFMPDTEIAERAQVWTRRERPVLVPAPGAYATLRGLMGPEGAGLAMYDDPGLVHDIADTTLRRMREGVFRVIEHVRPDVVAMGEDLCYNHGMLLSPAQFQEFFGRHYREVCNCARAAGAAMVAVDTDGNAMEYAPLAASYGVNAIYPFEVKAGNDLFALRDRMEDFVLFGWLEKETINEGNEAAIRSELEAKVPPLLVRGRYFPNGDHGIQPWATFPALCRFMTLLHELTGNPEGDFPRIDPS